MDKVETGLIGKSLWTCRRAADMATFQFGQRRETQDYYGRPTTVGEYALHVQCAWHIRKGDKVIVGSGDLYYPAGYIDGGDVPDGFDWEQSPNRRDELLGALFEGGTREFVVRQFDRGAGGTCRVELDDEVCLEIFPESSVAGEHWRLFETQEGGAQIVVR